MDTLAKRARALDCLDERLRRLLPDTIARECRLADVRDGRMIFLATGSTWAARLRLHHAALLAEASTVLGIELKQISVKVAPRPSVAAETVKHKPLSITAARHLQNAARSLSDPELAALFLRLASLAEQPSR
ncbi:MAG: DciA family protein [Dokdonella sp.]